MRSQFLVSLLHEQGAIWFRGQMPLFFSCSSRQAEPHSPTAEEDALGSGSPSAQPECLLMCSIDAGCSE